MAQHLERTERSTPTAAIALFVTVLSVAGCGVAAQNTNSSTPLKEPGSPLVLPGTTLVVTSVLDGGPVESVEPLTVTEPCPESATDISGEQDAMFVEVSRLEPMLGQALAYGGEHANEFGTTGMVWHGAGDASVFISFTSNLDVHRTALATTVEHPDELIVCQVGASADVAAAIEATLLVELEGRFVSIGRGANGLEVTLAPGDEALAEDLSARYGDAITLRVGVLPYPIEQATSVCESPPDRNERDGLDITINPPDGPLTATGTDPFELTVTLTNTGTTPIQFGSGISRGTIVDNDGNVVGSGVDVLDAGIAVDLAPGESTELPLVAGTSSCDPELGSKIPPGEYQIIASVQHSDGTNTTLHSAPLPITISD